MRTTRNPDRSRTIRKVPVLLLTAAALAATGTVAAAALTGGDDVPAQGDGTSSFQVVDATDQPGYRVARRVIRDGTAHPWVVDCPDGNHVVGGAGPRILESFPLGDGVGELIGLETRPDGAITAYAWATCDHDR